MKIISIRNDFGVSDISDEEDIQAFIGQIDTGSDVDIQLDLSGCLIDYPATSKVVDAILEQLSMLPGEKSLVIITNYALPMETVVNWLFLGSRRLDMEFKKGLLYKDLVQTLTTALQRENLRLQIKITDRQGNEINVLTIPS